MKQKSHILIFFFGLIFFPQLFLAQVDFNKLPKDDLGDVEDKFQEFFYEALKQKGIENYGRSAEALLKCIALNDSASVLYFELGKNYNKLKNFRSAEEALKKAVSKEPDNEWYLDELYGFYAEQNDYDNAIKTVKQLVKYHPDYKEDLASLYIRIKKYDKALELLDELDENLGVSLTRDAMRNKIYKLTGRRKDQIRNLEKRLNTNPNKESNYLALIFRYSENNEKEKAFQIAKELLKINPNSQVVHLALYKFYLEDNDTHKAINSMKTVLRSTQIKPDAKLKVLTDFVNFVKKNPQFESDLLEATALVSSNNDKMSLIELGQYYLTKGENEKALSYFEEAYKIEPNNFQVLRSILLLKIDLKQFELAKSQSEDALVKYPSQPLFYLINGVALNELNNPKEATQVLEDGLDYIIDDTKMEGDFYLQLSKAYTLLNNTTKAKTFSDKAKQLQSSN